MTRAEIKEEYRREKAERERSYTEGATRGAIASQLCRFMDSTQLRELLVEKSNGAKIYI